MSAIFEPCSERQALMLEKRATFTILGGAAGCLNVETEVLTEEGWIPFSDYKEGMKIANFFPEDYSIGYYIPEKFYAIPCKEFLKFTSKDFEITVCEDHTFSFIEDGEFTDLPASIIYTSIKNYGGYNGEILCTDGSGEGWHLPLSECSVSKVESSDGFKYCFSTLSGHFIVRQKGVPFVTGNSGKSYTMILDPLKYAHDPNFNAIVFRRTSVQLSGQGGLWQTARKVYSKIPKPHTPRFREKGMWAIFPMMNESGELILDARGKIQDGASIQFMHMEHEKNAIDHQGLQYSAEYFDEGTHFLWTMVDYLMSRLRSGAEEDSFIKISCNPDPDSWILKFISEHYLDSEGYPIDEMAGVVKWYVTVDGDLYWADTEEEALALFPELDLAATSFCFIPATIEHNPVLREQEPMYEKRLKALNPIDKARLYYGNWYIRPEGQSYADRVYFRKADRVPVGAISCRAWDKASSEYNPNAEGSNKWPDYTASIKMYKDRNGDIYVSGEYHESCRDNISNVLGRFRKRAGPRDNCIEAQAMYDGKDCTVVLPKDPGQSGAVEFAESSKKLNAKGFIVKADPAPSNASKLTRFLPFASALENGNIYIVESTFEKTALEAFYKELEKFDGERSQAHAGKHDDWVDAIASAYNYLSKTRNVRIVTRNQLRQPTVAADRLSKTNPLDN